MNIVFVGHVDHGKSTVIGRLMADTGSLPEGKLEMIREKCRRNSKPFEYAFLLDALKDEQAQGITIDTARCFFKTQKRKYIIIDAPGHVEFLKNMITGASRAEAAILVIDATEGIQENSKRHGYLLSILGIHQVVILVNKMDLVNYRQDIFDRIVRDYSDFLTKVNLKGLTFIPVSGFLGENIVDGSSQMAWYNGPTVVEMVDRFEEERLPVEKPFRMPVQDVYKFTKEGDNRRIVAGKIESGKIAVGQELVFYPSGKRSTVKSIEVFNQEPLTTLGTGYAAGLTLNEQIYIKRGEIAAISDEPAPKVTSQLMVNLFWLGKEPLELSKEYGLKLCTDKVQFQVERIVRVTNASTLESVSKNRIERHEVAECCLKLERPIAFDPVGDSMQTSRFVIIDHYQIAGGGIIQKGLDDSQSQVRERVLVRDYKWERSLVTIEERSERYNQKPCVILLTGPKDVDKKAIAKALESRLLSEGKIVYFLGIGNLLYGVDSDIKSLSDGYHKEHLRRLAEVSHLLVDAGLILIVTATELTKKDLKIFETVMNGDHIEVVWLGENITTDIPFDIHISKLGSDDRVLGKIKGFLQERGVIFKTW